MSQIYSVALQKWVHVIRMRSRVYSIATAKGALIVVCFDVPFLAASSQLGCVVMRADA